MNTDGHRLGLAFRTRRAHAGRAESGFTLVELLVVIGIIASLAGLILYAGSRVVNANKPTRAKAQLTMLADAIRRYSDAWPAWKYGTLQIAAKGYPDWCAARLFGIPGNPPTIRGQFVNPADAGMCWSLDFTYKIVDPQFPLPPGVPGTQECDPNNPNLAFQAQLHTAVECLAYSLTAVSSGGPYLREDQFNNVRLSSDGDEFYPHLPVNANQLQARREITDPWGHSLRYFWVYPSPSANNLSGWKAVLTADTTVAGYGVAKGVVIESAGPDGRFGNRWADNPVQQDLDESKDNLWELIQ